MPKHVLVVEDNPVVRMQITDILTDLHMEVAEAESGEEALALISDKTEINCLVTDVGILGSMDGLMLAELVLERRPSTMIVIATGRDLQSCDVPDGAILLRKPFGMQALEAALNQADQQQKSRHDSQ